MHALFRDRTQAGQQLAVKLAGYAHQPNVWVLALPRGGVPLAFEIANTLGLPWDIWLVRKLGVPGRPELAMGAIASPQIQIINWEVVNWLQISAQTITTVSARERQELARRDHAYRGEAPYPDLTDKTVILVDDGIATGSTLRAAIAALRQKHPQHIVVAAPIAATATVDKLAKEVDEVVCVHMTDQLYAISGWYTDFRQVSDDMVRYWLAQRSCQDVEEGRS